MQSNNTTLCQIGNMIINLSKLFHFRRDEDEYRCTYIFENSKNENGNKDVRLILKVSVNENEEKEYHVNKPTSVLFQPNDAIEQMVAEEVVAFSRTSVS